MEQAPDENVESTPLPMPLKQPLSALAARVLGCLIEKEFATPDLYPLSLNALTNACNQRSNRDPVVSASASEVEIALEELRGARLATMFSGADSRVQKFKHKLEAVFELTDVERALLCELLVRGPQTSAGLRSNSERLFGMPGLAEVDGLLAALSEPQNGPLVRKLPRLTGQKEARWVQLLTGEPALGEGEASVEPLTVALTIPVEVEQRLKALEGEVQELRRELTELRRALGE
jgi:uncharacterized protein YceH (UPF0502 family)